MPKVVRAFPKLMAQPMALEDCPVAAASMVKALESSSNFWPIDGDLNGISSALELYLL